jgi:hypothetical protein
MMDLHSPLANNPRNDEYPVRIIMNNLGNFVGIGILTSSEMLKIKEV